MVAQEWGPDPGAARPHAAVPAWPGLHFTGGSPASPPFCSGLGCFQRTPALPRPPFPAISGVVWRPGEQESGEETAGKKLWEYSPRSARPQTRPPSPAGAGRRSWGRRAGVRAPPPSQRSRGPEHWAPGGKRGCGRGAEPTSRDARHWKSPSPPSEPSPEATQREHAHCISRTPWDLACAGGWRRGPRASGPGRGAWPPWGFQRPPPRLRPAPDWPREPKEAVGYLSAAQRRRIEKGEGLSATSRVSAYSPPTNNQISRK